MNDIILALQLKIRRLKNKRKLSHIPQHEMSPLDIQIDAVQQHLKHALNWALYTSPAASQRQQLQQPTRKETTIHAIHSGKIN